MDDLTTRRQATLLVTFLVTRFNFSMHWKQGMQDRQKYFEQQSGAFCLDRETNPKAPAGIDPREANLAVRQSKIL
jgi:hypothetical protein